MSTVWAQKDARVPVCMFLLGDTVGYLLLVSVSGPRLSLEEEGTLIHGWEMSLGMSSGKKKNKKKR